MTVQKFSISLQPAVAAAVASRGGNRSTVISRDLARYYYLLAQAGKCLSHFSDDELGKIYAVIIAATNGDPASVKFLPAILKHELSADGDLVSRIGWLNELELFAMMDAAETRSE